MARDAKYRAGGEEKDEVNTKWRGNWRAAVVLIHVGSIILMSAKSYDIVSGRVKRKSAFGEAIFFLFGRVALTRSSTDTSVCRVSAYQALAATFAQMYTVW